MKEARDIINRLKLKPHPEGGYFKETYRSAEIIQTPLGPRNYSTSIYFLLTSDAFSAFHKINQDEVWHFYEGSPITLHVISPKGNYTHIQIGRNIEAGETLQYVVPAGHWFAAEVSKENSFALVGCTVSPGFDFADFTLAVRSELVAQFPNHKQLITKLSRS